ncbi:MAG: hypothetical protein QXZ17_14625 [Nitrososphaerota archaeon]
MTEFRTKGRGINRKVYPIRKSYSKETIYDEMTRRYKNKPEKLEGYYQGKGSDPLDAISNILRQIDTRPPNDESEIQYIDWDTNDSTTEDKIRKKGKGQWDVTIYYNGKYYLLSGTVTRGKRSRGRWEAGAEVEEIEL